MPQPIPVPILTNRKSSTDLAMPALLAGLGKRLPTDYQPLLEPDTKPVEELVLTLSDPLI